ncbi:FKBP-type peptidyl-prolyl cis-trans isomerase [Nocardioides sp. zg-DK7169]|uniref:FKBP-type peptidyl-prolyl cis-trans isomerase n=1 Tax=Nocardioides sp. zg-DK7169 TaxID=2736600 RepID=UPI00155292D9|nr:FKBP-type peptidyl-prolyl cis-trans isomerase [Nocardioides sp. zg-DK7169]
MSRRLRRLPALLAPLLLLPALAACGEDDAATSASADDLIASLSIKGEPGKAIRVGWDGRVEMDKGSDTTVLSEGDGEEVAAGNEVTAHIWIGNGYTETKSFSTYDSKAPQALTLDDTLADGFRDSLEGQQVGSRIATVAVADEFFGAGGNPSLQIANKDTIVVVMDILSTAEVLDEPQGKEQAAPAWAPELVTNDSGDVTGLDFTDAPKPNGKLRAADLVVGDGAKVESGQTIKVNYLGQVYGGKAPFDESFSKSPASFAIGAGQVIKGWDKALVGRTIGSRVLVAIPPAWGYGEKGQPAAGIKGTDTLYFVVDVLAAS